jgi:ADP-ribose pyrophosphatase YjhB (NUDIX family)
MVESAGIAIIYDNKILLAHPTNSGRQMWGIPKGKIEEGENYATAASRETKEEIGIYIDPNLLKNVQVIEYKNKKTKRIYKKVFYFIHKISNLNEVGLSGLKLDKTQLELREVDRARFMRKEEAEDLIFWRQKSILEYLT